MVINEKTKIAHILKEHPDALQIIVALSPDFKKLLNPILRKLVAGRATIAMASKMGGVKPQDFFNALKPMGFEVDENYKSTEKIVVETSLPEFLGSRKKEQIIEFDVRKMIADGGDPLRPIQEKVRKLKVGEVLLIVADFQPVPLIRLLGNQGFESHVRTLAADKIETYFYKSKQKEGDVNELKVDDVENSDDWEEIMSAYQDALVEIDVRQLEMPGPMVAILEALEELPEEKALYVNHKKVPMFLLSELKDRNFDYRINELENGEVKLIIFKAK